MPKCDFNKVAKVWFGYGCMGVKVWSVWVFS